MFQPLFFQPKFEKELPATPKIDKTGWARPAVDKDLGITKSIACQVLEVETYHEDGSATTYDRTNVKLYGVTKAGNSICVIVTDYFPHFYFQVNLVAISQINLIYYTSGTTRLRSRTHTNCSNCHL